MVPIPILYSLCQNLLEKHKTALINVAFDLLQKLPIFRSLPGLYEVLDYEATLELLNTSGKTAIYHKIQKVRFIQNSVIAYQDTAWGDGNIFADFKCTPGVEVDRYREGHRYNILISLRETKHRDDEETFHIERKITDGFTQKVEEFQVDIDHRTRKLAFSVIFPAKRTPQSVRLTEQNTRRTHEIDVEGREKLPDGRLKYTWRSEHPRLFEAYIMRWEW